jgi:hypothetical protein
MDFLGACVRPSKFVKRTIKLMRIRLLRTFRALSICRQTGHSSPQQSWSRWLSAKVPAKTRETVIHTAKRTNKNRFRGTSLIELLYGSYFATVNQVIEKASVLHHSAFAAQLFTPIPNKATAYFTGSSGQKARSFYVRAATAFLSLAWRSLSRRPRLRAVRPT